MPIKKSFNLSDFIQFLWPAIISANLRVVKQAGQGSEQKQRTRLAFNNLWVCEESVNPTNTH